ncbi:GNAT family N-acetyltransferase [Alkalibacillus aidingensis]|uniref:GNAT family N-acetyltransferase n=1 Tax=Alkalibacillus aidingensis TaxID=2747607 RepID=UPI0016604950|nr:GNAT family N-acetyltransferase [Alkalibacillus aidingensis]
MIRKATYTDLNQIEALVNQAKDIMANAGMTQWGESYPTKRHYEEDLNQDELYVYEYEGEVVGVACISDHGHHEYDEINWSEEADYLCIKRLAVDPNVRMQGIGLAFYQFAEELAAERGVSYIRTDTNGENTAALRLFEKGEYTLVDKQRHGDFKQPFYYYEKKVMSHS